MHFVPRSNRYYGFLMHVKPWHRYISTFFIIVSFVSVWFFCVYSPIERAIVSYQDMLSLAYKQKDLAVKIQANCQQRKKTINNLETTVQQLIFRYKPLGNTHACGTFLIEQIVQSPVQLVRYKRGGEKETPFYKKYSMHMELLGSFPELIALMRQMLNLPTVYISSSFTITQQNGDRFLLRTYYNAVTFKKS